MNHKQYVIDVDNPEYPSEKNPIAMHSQIAKYYQFRPPYNVDFFQQLVSKASIKPTANILDLCCGRGELASGISRFVNSVYGVDGSADMLSNSIKDSNVFYHQANVNEESLPFQEKFDHILIGSAIHWVKHVSLTQIINRHLNAGGNIVVTHTLFRFDAEKFNEPLRRLNKKFGRVGRPVDFVGKQKIEKCGFRASHRLLLEKNVAFDIQFLYANQLSYAYYEFYDKIMANPDAYRKEFYEAVSPFAANGRLRAKLVNWAVIYGAI